MTTEQLSSAIHAVPFRPFTLKLADSRSVDVPHPDFIAYVPKTRTAAVGSVKGSFEVIDLLLIVGIEFKETPNTAMPKRGR